MFFFLLNERCFINKHCQAGRVCLCRVELHKLTCLSSRLESHRPFAIDWKDQTGEEFMITYILYELEDKRGLPTDYSHKAGGAFVTPHVFNI